MTLLPPTQALCEALAQLAQQTSEGDYVALSGNVLALSGHVCDVIEAASQSAYLVGVADPCSIAASTGVVDHAKLTRSSHLLSVACQNLSTSDSSSREVRCSCVLCRSTQH